MAKMFAPIVGRFTRTHDGYTPSARLERWERSAIESLPQMRPPRGGGGTISNSCDNWDDCDA